MDESPYRQPSEASGLILPPRPWRLATGYRLKMRLAAAAIVLAGLSVFAGCTLLAVRGARQILADEAIWRSGKPATEVKISGTITGTIFTSYALDVEYLDAAGTLHRGHAFFSCLGRPDKSAHLRLVTGSVHGDRFALTLDVPVHYDPTDPDRFSVEWSVHSTTERWLEGIITWVIGVLFAFLITLFRGEPARRVRDFERWGVEGQECRFPVDANYAFGASARRSYSYHLPNGKTETVVFKKGTAPLRAGAARELVALRSPDDTRAPLVLRDDLYPFAFSPPELSAMAERAKRGSAATAQ